MKKPLLLIGCGLILSFTASAAPTKSMIKDYSEDEASLINAANKRELNKDEQKFLEAYKKRVQDSFKVEGGLRQGNIAAGRRTEPPGFISAREITPPGQVIGPITVGNSIRIDDLIYIRWSGTPTPKEGEIYSTVTPALVMQSEVDPTDFEIGVPTDMNKLPKHYHLAGYLYETTGFIRITKITQGMVEARVTGLRGQVAVGDRVMPPLPIFKEVPPVYSENDITATIVAGNPVNRLSTTQGSYLYLNRGMRDGVKLGQMFSAMESVRLKYPVHETPKTDLGTVKVIYVSDAYSTAVISQQFDIIRIGSLLHSMPSEGTRESSQENFPNMEALPTSPESEAPGVTPPAADEKHISELDALEKSMRDGALSPAERERLNRLHLQSEKANPEAEENEDQMPEVPSAEEEQGKSEVPELPPIENSFQKKNTKKKDDKKRPGPKFRDEERLNEMMQ